MSETAPTIAITGANGFLGSTLVDHFVEKGWQVRALVRNPGENTDHVTYERYSLDGSIDDSVLKGAQYLVHAAYVKQDRDHPDAYDTNVQAAKNIVAAAKENNLKKSLFLSSMSAHDEAISSYGRQKLEIEKIFSGPDCVSIRSGLIIGNGGIVKDMTDLMRSKHIAPLVGGGKQPLQTVAVEDLCFAIDKVLQSDISGVLTVATPQVYTYKEVFKAIAKHADAKVFYPPVPFFVLINAIRIVNRLPISMAINPDNALGLKALRSADTAPDLKKIGVQLKDLNTALSEI